jgi:hypothetical protein
MFVAGIDENGLGPKLGPLVVTGALFETEGDRYDPERFRRALGGATRFGGTAVADSKAVMSAGNMARGETTVLGLAGLLGAGIPATADGFLDLVCDPPPPALRERCPSGASEPCFGPDLDLPRFGGATEEAREVMEGLRGQMEREGVHLRAVSSEVLCPSRFNECFAGEGGPSKADVDLASMEGRIRALASRFEGEGVYLCGKVMNLIYYSPKLALASDHPLLRRSESKAESFYHLQGLGEIRFLLDGDRDHLPIAAASMFGKLVRELFMARFNRFFGERIDGHRHVSGYGDPVTRAFIEGAGPILEGENIPSDCFLRRR